jgi:hypothetical protein
MIMARNQPRREASWSDRALTVKIGKKLARYPYPIVGEGAVLADIAGYRNGIEDMTSRIVESSTHLCGWPTPTLRPPRSTTSMPGVTWPSVR